MNNAGIGGSVPLTQQGTPRRVSLEGVEEPERRELYAANWQRNFSINLEAQVTLSQLLLPSLMRNGEGRIVNIASVDGHGQPYRADYSASKAGLLMLVKAMAVELAPTVRTVGVSPGQVIWPEDYDAETRARLAARVPLKRVGTPQDIAKMVRFLALEAPYVNGEIIAVDGGLSKRY